mgnify:CR=1 FL=1
MDVLLVLGDEILHVRLGLGELHLVHALTGVPVEERLAAEHGRELGRDSAEELLNGGGLRGKVVSERSRAQEEGAHVSNEGDRLRKKAISSARNKSEKADHLETAGRDLAVSGLNVVGDPLCSTSDAVSIALSTKSLARTHQQSRQSSSAAPRPCCPRPPSSRPFRGSRLQQ